jgi:EAL domain-containing protein (putative c-di-GMP-specific phosphodiesterase class I)
MVRTRATADTWDMNEGVLRLPGSLLSTRSSSERLTLFGVLGIKRMWMAFQPIFCLSDLSVAGLEALARFQGTKEKAPDGLFARAEAMGFAELLEMKAVRLALERAPEIPEQVFLAVNVSAATAVSPRLVRAVEGRGRRLVIEITEHGPVRDYEALWAAMKRLRGLGVRVAVDDAGAGFAGFGHVVRVLPDLIKLDLGITRGIEKDAAKRSLVSAVVLLALTTGSAVVAEGIETQTELDTLAELGVAYGQGFYLARPMAFPDLAAGGFLSGSAAAACSASTPA